MSDPMILLLTRWRTDPAALYRTWFLDSQRLGCFRAVRAALKTTVARVEAGTFGNVYRGTSLSEAVQFIEAQASFLKGLNTALVWRPKIRSPDIYEHPGNQREFGRLLDECLRARSEPNVGAAIRRLTAAKIRGIGPSIASLLYHLHPTILPPYSSAIVRGFNALTNSRIQPGCWAGYFDMRDGIQGINNKYLPLLSDDLGAVTALLADVGCGRYPAPPDPQEHDALAAWESDIAKFRIPQARARNSAVNGGPTHIDVQAWLRDLGWSLGYDVSVAVEDRNRPFGHGRLGDGCLSQIPDFGTGICADIIQRIDVLWISKASRRIVAAFEVEHSTSVLTGLLRMLTLACGPEPHELQGIFIIAPDHRVAAIQAQSGNPAFSLANGPEVRCLSYSELQSNRAIIPRFGPGVTTMQYLGHPLSRPKGFPGDNNQKYRPETRGDLRP